MMNRTLINELNNTIELYHIMYYVVICWRSSMPGRIINSRRLLVMNLNVFDGLISFLNNSKDELFMVIKCIGSYLYWHIAIGGFDSGTLRKLTYCLKLKHPSNESLFTIVLKGQLVGLLTHI